MCRAKSSCIRLKLWAFDRSAHFRLLVGTAFEASVKGAIEQLLMQVQRPQKRASLVDVESRLEDRFLYLPATPIKELSETAAEVLDTLIDACAQLRVCTIDYVRAGAQGQSERMTIHPYALVLYKDTIYCIAWVVERNALRTLRADRMLDADVRATEHFELPAGFSVDDHFEGQFGLFRGTERIRVVADFDPDIADLVRGRPFPGPDPGSPSTHDFSGGRRARRDDGVVNDRGDSLDFELRKKGPRRRTTRTCDIGCRRSPRDFGALLSLELRAMRMDSRTSIQ